MCHKTNRHEPIARACRLKDQIGGTHEETLLVRCDLLVPLFVDLCVVLKSQRCFCIGVIFAQGVEQNLGGISQGNGDFHA